MRSKQIKVKFKWINQEKKPQQPTVYCFCNSLTTNTNSTVKLIANFPVIYGIGCYPVEGVGFKCDFDGLGF